MSSAAYLNWEPEAAGVTGEQWVQFCAANNIHYSPHTTGHNVFYAGAVEISFGDSNYEDLPRLANGKLDFAAARPPQRAHRITFSTYTMGSVLPEVARLAMLAWTEFGGSLEAAPEIRNLIGRTFAPEPADEPVADTQASRPQPRLTPDPDATDEFGQVLGSARGANPS